MYADTIVAIATPPGRGGLGVVRLSGPQAFEIAARLIQLSKLPLPDRHATLGQLVEPDSGRVLDEVIVTGFRSPHSYTAEDVIEISCHGAPVILGYLVERILAAGARAAEPGEFTERAFLNGRIDLTQAEAIRDLIESRTLYQARVAAAEMHGSVSARLQPLKQSLIDLIARLEAGIDFADDDVPVVGWDEILQGAEAIRVSLEKLASSYEYGRIIREGLSLAIVGRPNVGKSSLFNRLLNQDRAIVTAVPGTTRDLVSESASLDGIPLRFVDTAGIRDTTDEVETLGVVKSWQAIADSDLRLLVIDASSPWTGEDQRLFEKLKPLGALVLAHNKSDLIAAARNAFSPQDDTAVWISALTGEGIEELCAKILETAVPGGARAPEGELISNLRHQQLIRGSLAAIERALEAVAARAHHEMLLLDFYDALHALDGITGLTTTDDVLGVIFSTFCIGK